MNTDHKTAGGLEDIRVPVKLKLSALWAATLFLYAYGDIIGFFRSDVLAAIKAGKIAAFEINQVFLFGVSVYILIPSAMVFLSLVMRPEVNRWANLVLGVVYLLTNAASAIGESWAYYVFLTSAESVFLLLIVWHAWRWPRERVSAA